MEDRNNIKTAGAGENMISTSKLKMLGNSESTASMTRINALAEPKRKGDSRTMSGLRQVMSQSELANETPGK